MVVEVDNDHVGVLQELLGVQVGQWVDRWVAQKVAQRVDLRVVHWVQGTLLDKGTAGIGEAGARHNDRMEVEVHATKYTNVSL